jgi:hypothetical protein
MEKKIKRFTNDVQTLKITARRRFKWFGLAFFPLVERPLCRRSPRNLSTVNDCRVCCENPEIASSARLKTKVYEMEKI